MDQLAGLLQTWLAARTPAPEVVETNKMSKTTEDSPDGIPHGLVGSDCIKKGTICLGDNQDTSTYAFSPKVILSDTDIVFVAGVNHIGTTTGANSNVMVYPNVVCAGVEYN